MPITTEQGAAYTAGAVTLLAGVFKGWKIFMQTMRVDRMESTAMMSDLTSYKRLQEEIARLEAIIRLQHNRIEKMEGKFEEMRETQLEDVADIASLNILLRGFPCGSCSNPADTFVQTREILTGMGNRRRKAKFDSIKIDAEAQCVTSNT